MLLPASGGPGQTHCTEVWVTGMATSKAQESSILVGDTMVPIIE